MPRGGDSNRRSFFWGLAFIGLIIVDVSKGGCGGGLGVVDVPFLATAIPVNQAAAIMLPCLIIMDLAGIYGWRGQWRWEQLKRLLPAAGVGVCFGALSLIYDQITPFAS